MLKIVEKSMIALPFTVVTRELDEYTEEASQSLRSRQ